MSGLSIHDYAVYIGTYSQPADYPRRAHGRGIYSYRLDYTTGRLSPLSQSSYLDNPAYLAIDASKRYLYAVSEAPGREGAIYAFALLPDGEFSFINSQPSFGTLPTHLTIDATGQYVLAANYMDGASAVMLPIAADGGLLPVCYSVQHVGTGPVAARQEKPHAHCVMLDPSNTFLYVPDLGIDQIMIYRLDLENGYLIPATSQSLHLEAGSGPRHLEFHPRGKFAYVIQELNSTVSVLAFDPVSGAFEILQTISSLPADYQGESYAAAIHVSPDGKFLYASNRGHDSLALFVIDDDTGTLTCMGHQPTGGTTPRDFGIDPSGKYLLAANQNSDTVVTFRIHPQTGFLEETGEVAKVPTPVCVKII